MVPGKYPIVIYKGATWSISITGKDENGVDRNFSEYDSIRLQIGIAWVKDVALDTAKLKLTTENGRITLTGEGKVIVLTLTAAETKAITFKAGQYELELIKNATTDPVAAEIIDKFLIGSVTIVPETVL